MSQLPATLVGKFRYSGDWWAVVRVVVRIFVDVIIYVQPGLNSQHVNLVSQGSKGFTVPQFLPESSQPGPVTGPGTDDQLTSWLGPSTLHW